MGYLRDLPSKKLEYKGTLTTSTVTAATATCLVFQLILSNIDTSADHLVTITNGESSPATMVNQTIASGDPWIREFPQGWEFTSGIKILCDANSAVRCEILGRQLYA
jgi:hypothetical protein